MTVDFEFLSVVLLIIYLEGILSIDNAAILGAMVSGLPADEWIPWPRSLRFLSRSAHRLLGGQRSAALKVGLLGAYVGRGAMLVLASFVIQNPWLRILGGLYLIKLAFENLGEAEKGEQEQVETERATRRGFWSVVLAVEIADLAFSLDNVVAVIALSNELWLIMFGVAMGILTMRFAAGIFTRLIAKEPALKPAAYLIVLIIGIELILEEFSITQVDEIASFVISGGTLVAAVIYGRSRPLHILRPVFRWMAEGMANINELIDWALRPIYLVARIAFKGLAMLFRAVRLPRLKAKRDSSLASETASESSVQDN